MITVPMGTVKHMW